MPANIEIKAYARDFQKQCALAAGLASSPSQRIAQEDWFFACERGRLKLRVFGDGRGELIAYQREDQAQAKRSDYLISPTQDAQLLRETLARALDLIGVVRKRRTLFLLDQTRIHLDEVEGLGQFLELEVVLRADQTSEEGQAIAAELVRALQIDATDLIATAYIDLLKAKVRSRE